MRRAGRLSLHQAAFSTYGKNRIELGQTQLLLNDPDLVEHLLRDRSYWAVDLL